MATKKTTESLKQSAVESLKLKMDDINSYHEYAPKKKVKDSNATKDDKDTVICIRYKESEKKALKKFCIDNNLNMTSFIKQGIAELQMGIKTGKYEIIAGQIKEIT